MIDPPDGLGLRGSRLWAEIVEVHELDPSQRVLLEESCRSADRLDELDSIIQGKGVLNLMRFRVADIFDDGEGEKNVRVEVKFDAVLGEARQQQTVLKQLLASLRLPDAATGKKPQRRDGARGSYTPGGSTGGARVSSLARARAAKTS